MSIGKQLSGFRPVIKPTSIFRLKHSKKTSVSHFEVSATTALSTRHNIVEHFKIQQFSIYRQTKGRDSSVVIATHYWLDGLGSNPGGGEIFRTRRDRPCDPPSLLYSGYRVFPRGKAAGAWH